MSHRTIARLCRLGFVTLCAAIAASTAQAQGRGNGHGHGPPGGMPPGQAKKVVTVDRAVDVTREVLVSHGYDVVRVEIVRGQRVVYYRRGNRGHGRGWGPVYKMVIVPDAERVRFESAPKGILVDIDVRLGL